MIESTTMNLLEFVKSGTHPLYQLGMWEQEYLDMGRNVQQLRRDAVVSFYLDDVGNEVCFVNDSLFSIALQVAAGYSMVIGDDAVHGNSTLAEILNIFERGGVDWSMYTKWCQEKQVAVISEGGVVLIFEFMDSDIFLRKMFFSASNKD